MSPRLRQLISSRPIILFQIIGATSLFLEKASVFTILNKLGFYSNTLEIFVYIMLILFYTFVLIILMDRLWNIFNYIVKGKFIKRNPPLNWAGTIRRGIGTAGLAAGAALSTFVAVSGDANTIYQGVKNAGEALESAGVENAFHRNSVDVGTREWREKMLQEQKETRKLIQQMVSQNSAITETQSRQSVILQMIAENKKKWSIDLI